MVFDNSNRIDFRFVELNTKQDMTIYRKKESFAIVFVIGSFMQIQITFGMITCYENIHNYGIFQVSSLALPITQNVCLFQ